VEIPRGHITTDDALVLLVQEFRRVASELDEVKRELSRLNTRVQRPDLQKYSVQEASARLRRSESTVWEMIKSGEIEAVKEKGRRYITEEAVQTWERKQRHGQ
jgi:excisionase family DNA binding protein